MKTARIQHIAWRPLECHAWESAWSIAHKFCRWNGARLAELWSLVAADPCLPLPPSRQYLRYAEWIDREKFGTIFRLSADRVQNAFWERYAPDPHQQVYLVDPRHLRFCPSCARRGFHSPLHDVLLFAQCPIHREPLVEACPSCRKVICAEVTRAASCDPYMCSCGHVLWPSLRSPALSSAESQALHAAVGWLDRNSAAIRARIHDFSIREEDFGDPQSIIVSEAIRCIPKIDPHAPAYVARPKSSRTP